MLEILKARFQANKNLHMELSWLDVEKRLLEHPGSMDVLRRTEELYRRLQSLGEFDLKTSSWITTPDDIRDKGGALFCERRYGMVLTFHNGADSYYSVRGFRGYTLI